MSDTRITISVEIDRRDVRDARELRTDMQGEASFRADAARERLLDAIYDAATEAQR